MGKHHRNRDWDGMAEEMRRLNALRKGETYVHNPEDQLRGSLGDSPDNSEDEAEDGGRDNAAPPGTGAEAGAGQLMTLGGLKEEPGGEDAAGQGGSTRSGATPRRRRSC